MKLYALVKRSLAPALMTVMALSFPVIGMADSSQRLKAVVCVTEGRGPWVRKAQGTLIRTRGRNELVYKFESEEQSFEWRFVTSSQGNTTAVGPGFLMDRFLPIKSEPSPDSPRGPLNAAPSGSDLTQRRQSLQATGEIRERDESRALALLIGSNCR
jgi:hypothetical protein